MKASVFFRMETFGQRARCRKGRRPTDWRNIDGVVAEASRRIGGAPHVKGADRIEVIAGEAPLEIGRVAIDQARRAVDRRGHRLREDGAAFVACVASYHVEGAVLMQDPVLFEAYDHWRWRVVDWVTGRWPDHRFSIVEHRDERYFHLHVLLVPRLGACRRLLVEDLHPGIAARDRLQQEGRSTAAQNVAYRQAMSDLLDDYHLAVGAPAGQARSSASPRRRRTREQAMTDARQRQREQTLRAHEVDLLVAEAHLGRRFSDLEIRIAAADEARRGFNEAREALQRQRHAFEKASASERARLEAELVSKEAELAAASARVAAAHADNVATAERQAQFGRHLMASDRAGLLSENQRMRAELDDARRLIAALSAEREELIQQEQALRTAI